MLAPTKIFNQHGQQIREYMFIPSGIMHDISKEIITLRVEAYPQPSAHLPPTYFLEWEVSDPKLRDKINKALPYESHLLIANIEARENGSDDDRSFVKEYKIKSSTFGGRDLQKVLTDMMEKCVDAEIVEHRDAELLISEERRTAYDDPWRGTP